MMLTSVIISYFGAGLFSFFRPFIYSGSEKPLFQTNLIEAIIVTLAWAPLSFEAARMSVRILGVKNGTYYILTIVVPPFLIMVAGTSLAVWLRW